MMLMNATMYVFVEEWEKYSVYKTAVESGIAPDKRGFQATFFLFLDENRVH